MLCALMLAATASASDLKKFEKAAKSSSSSSSSASESKAADSFIGLFLDLFGDAVAEGTSASVSHFQERKAGDVGLPRLRVENAYQHLSGNLDGYAARAAVGHSVFGASVEAMRYWEHDPKDRLDSLQAEALYRLGGPGGFFNLAMGYRALKVTETQDGAQGGFSFGLYPWKRIGFETDLRWCSISGTALGDHRARVVYRLGAGGLPLTLSAGYRGIRAGGSTLHGPEVLLGTIW